MLTSDKLCYRLTERIEQLEAKNALLGATQRKIQELCESNKGLQRSRTGWTSAVLRIIAQHTRQSKLQKAYEETASNRG